MLSRSASDRQLGFYSTFEEHLNPKHPLYILANQVNWQLFEQEFSPLFDALTGRPAKPIRRMVALLILKHLRNLSDESVVEQWSENSYYQYFSGEKYFATTQPCDASELVHFRYRIGQQGIELILRESIRINGKDGDDDQVSVDTTVQEKNITFPTDAKLHKKIITKCHKIAAVETFTGFCNKRSHFLYKSMYNLFLNIQLALPNLLAIQRIGVLFFRKLLILWTVPAAYLYFSLKSNCQFCSSGK